ncbi:XRE family transcriptional regulator [bacterium 1XD42-1]|nr:XRE family transcriptional regulator [bacterium 1XD42-8]RKJ60917.1 XRE family transcriptional regulator [bacterium 1XD42-1]
MYRNLEAELVRAGLSKQELAKKIGCTPSTLSMKLNGKSPLSLAEASKIKQIVGVDISLEELFAAAS